MVTGRMSSSTSDRCRPGTTAFRLGWSADVVPWVPAMVTALTASRFVPGVHDRRLQDAPAASGLAPGVRSLCEALGRCGRSPIPPRRPAAWPRTAHGRSLSPVANTPSQSSKPDVSALDLRRRLALVFRHGADVLERSAQLADQDAQRRARQGQSDLFATELERSARARAAARQARERSEHFMHPIGRGPGDTE
jgi:hypothetical protein